MNRFKITVFIAAFILLTQIAVQAGTACPYHSGSENENASSPEQQQGDKPVQG